MKPFKLEWAATKLGVDMHSDVLVQTVSTDTRTLERGSLYFALPGENSDGHIWLFQAADKGAVGAVVSKRNSDCALPQIVVKDTLEAYGTLAHHYRTQFSIPLVGITGSYGKTSVKEMVASILANVGNTLCSEANYNNEIGVPKTLFQLDDSHKFAVIEMGMRGMGQIDYLARIAQPNCAVITALGLSHVELLGSPEKIAEAKSEILLSLAPDNIAVLPRDTALFPILESRVPAGVRTVTFSASADSGADVCLSQDQKAINYDNNLYPLKIGLPGSHHKYNACAAFATAMALGIDPFVTMKAIGEWKGATGRMSIRTSTMGYTILDDCYNAAPESMLAALRTLVELASDGSRVAILGDMRELGDYSAAAHKQLGAQVIDANLRLLITVGESSKLIAMEAIRDCPDLQSIHYPEASTALNEVKSLLQPHDFVLIKGSHAMQLETIVEHILGEGARTND